MICFENVFIPISFIIMISCCCYLGGFGAWSIVISAFIADTSTPSNRSMRYGMLKLSETLGKPLGALLGNYILNEGTYLGNYLSLTLLFVNS